MVIANHLRKSAQTDFMRQSRNVTERDYPVVAKARDALCEENGITNQPLVRVFYPGSSLANAAQGPAIVALPERNAVVMNSAFLKMAAEVSPEDKGECVVKAMLAHEMGHILARHWRVTDKGDEYEADKIAVVLLDGDIKGLEGFVKSNAKQLQQALEPLRNEAGDNAWARGVKGFARAHAQGINWKTYGDPRERITVIREARDMLKQDSPLRQEVQQMIAKHNQAIEIASSNGVQI